MSSVPGAKRYVLISIACSFIMFVVDVMGNTVEA